MPRRGRSNRFAANLVTGSSVASRVTEVMVVRRYVRDMRFERMSSAYEADGVPNSPNPVCACRDTAISAGSHIVGASGEVLHFPSGYQEAWRDGVMITRIPHNGRWGGYLTSHALPVLLRSGNSSTPNGNR